MERLLSIKELSEWIGLSVATLYSRLGATLSTDETLRVLGISLGTLRYLIAR